ncbi:MAG: SWIM zinc finger family protein [Planctomycetes bacterium]|nr:SWIM zinc finger family protein [Planctomycetota bacterium]
MPNVNEAFIEAAAPNAEAARNGRTLALKNQLVALQRSEDGTLWLGRCQGSGRTVYLCSADFIDPDKPVYRCTCPSRQFPCKHALGLLYAIAGGKTFHVVAVPEDVVAKRVKAAARGEANSTDAAKPRRVNKSALAKKIRAQLEGIDLLEKLTQDVVRLGIGTMNAKMAGELEEQAKQLGNAYLPGAQTALRNYTTLFRSEQGDELSAAGREAVYGEALDQLGRLYALIRRGRAYLQKRLEDPELAPETESSIAAWLGHAWQLRELKACGLVQTDVELVQLAFNTRDDVARQEYVDTGLWMHLGNGRIFITQTFRPYKAVKFIKSEDSFFEVAQVQELCVYPGDLNPRVRWDKLQVRPLERRDLIAMRGHARDHFATVIKDVKSHLKVPLADRCPVFALAYRRLGAVGREFVVEDRSGERLVITDAGVTGEPRSSHLLSLLPREFLEDQTLIVRFRHDLDTGKLQVKPLSVVTESGVIRLTL